MKYKKNKPWTPKRVLAITQSCGVFEHNPYCWNKKSRQRGKAVQQAIKLGYIYEIRGAPANRRQYVERN